VATVVFQVVLVLLAGFGLADLCHKCRDPALNAYI
jgi:hypothetical protein